MDLRRSRRHILCPGVQDVKLKNISIFIYSGSFNQGEWVGGSSKHVRWTYKCSLAYEKASRVHSVLSCPPPKRLFSPASVGFHDLHWIWWSKQETVMFLSWSGLKKTKNVCLFTQIGWISVFNAPVWGKCCKVEYTVPLFYLYLDTSEKYTYFYLIK